MLRTNTPRREGVAEPILNIVLRNDLIEMLQMTRVDRRVAVACAFAGVRSYSELAALAGYNKTTVCQWLGKQSLALSRQGAGRIAGVFGVPVELLFEGHPFGDAV